MPKQHAGKIVNVKELNAYGLTIELDNGVTITASFNLNHEVNLHFSKIDPKGLVIKEQRHLLRPPLNLANYVTVVYEPNSNNR